MSTPNKKKKVVVTTGKKKVRPTVSKKKQGKSYRPEPLIFGKDNYKWVLIGLGVIFLGFALMSGGSMPSPDVWDDSLIYSFRRITLAPIVIMIGLGIEVYAIFK